MVQKLKQYKMAESEKSVLSPPLSCAPHFPVSKGTYFFSSLGSPSAVAIRPALICSVLAVNILVVTLPFSIIMIKYKRAQNIFSPFLSFTQKL